jgi:hypothetical protein
MQAKSQSEIQRNAKRARERIALSDVDRCHRTLKVNGSAACQSAARELGPDWLGVLWASGGEMSTFPRIFVFTHGFGTVEIAEPSSTALPSAVHAFIEAVGNNLQCQDLHFCLGLAFGGAIGEATGELWHFGDPAAIDFAFGCDGEVHG